MRGSPVERLWKLEQEAVASGGAMDMLIRLQRPAGDDFQTRKRQLEAFGRFPHSIHRTRRRHPQR